MTACYQGPSGYPMGLNYGRSLAPRYLDAITYVMRCHGHAAHAYVNDNAAVCGVKNWNQHTQYPNLASGRSLRFKITLLMYCLHAGDHQVI